jgi:hypothetical protein
MYVLAKLADGVELILRVQHSELNLGRKTPY